MSRRHSSNEDITPLCVLCGLCGSLYFFKEILNKFWEHFFWVSLKKEALFFELRSNASSWYKKTYVTFSGVLAYIRNQILRTKYHHWFDKNNEMGNTDLKEIIEQMAAA